LTSHTALATFFSFYISTEFSPHIPIFYSI